MVNMLIIKPLAFSIAFNYYKVVVYVIIYH